MHILANIPCRQHLKMQFGVSLSATTEALNSFLPALPTQALPLFSFLPPKASHGLAIQSHWELYPQLSGGLFRDRKVVTTVIPIKVIPLYLSTQMQRFVSLL